MQGQARKRQKIILDREHMLFNPTSFLDYPLFCNIPIKQGPHSLFQPNNTSHNLYSLAQNY